MVSGDAETAPGAHGTQPLAIRQASQIDDIKPSEPGADGIAVPAFEGRGVGGRRARAGAVVGSLAVLACLALHSASATAASRSPFQAHGVFASCGKGEKRETAYLMYLSLRSHRGFDDVEALFRYAERVRPRGARIRIAGHDRVRRLRPAAARLPGFIFIDYLQTKGGPRAAARGRSTLSWRNEAGQRLHESLRFHRLGKDVCLTEGRNAERKAMLRELGGTGEPNRRDAARSATAATALPRGMSPGTYYGIADDGTELSFVLDGDGRIHEIKAHATHHGLSYEARLPATALFASSGCELRTRHEASDTGHGYSPAAELKGSCAGTPNRFKVTLTDRAGERTFYLDRLVAKPGLYEGRFWHSDRPHGGTDTGSIRFQINDDGSLENPVLEGTHRWYSRGDGYHLQTANARLGADGCQLGFFFQIDRDDRGGTRPPSRATYDGGGSCERGGIRFTGQLRVTMTDNFWTRSLAHHWKDFDWEARRVGAVATVVNGCVIRPHTICYLANLSGADLSGTNLSGASLYRADLHLTDLSWADLSRAYLAQAKLSQANLSRADLHRADAHRADLSHATLSRASLSDVKLFYANLAGADLSGANLDATYLNHANLSGADLSGADLHRANFDGADLAGAILTGARFCHTTMPNRSVNNSGC